MTPHRSWMEGLRWQARDPWEGLRLHATATFDQASWRFRNDDGDEATATWKAAERVAVSGQAIGQNFRLRYEIQETGGSSEDRSPLLQFSLDNGATWQGDSFDMDSASTSPVRLANSPNVGATDPTADRLVTGTGTYVAGEIFEDFSNGGNAVMFPALGHTEWEWVLELNPNYAWADGDAVLFRVLLAIPGGSYVTTDTNTGGHANLTVSATVAPPGQVTGLHSTGRTRTTVDLAWDPTANTDAYDVEMDGVVIGSVLGTTAQVQNLQPETTYTFRVRATNSGGAGPYSDPISVTTHGTVLVGSTNSAAGASGELVGTRGLSGAAAAASSASGTLSAGTGVTQLAGSAAAASAATGALGVTRGLTASTDAASAAGGDLRRLRGLAGASPAAAAASGRLDATWALEGQADAASGAEAALDRARPLEGQANAASSAGAEINRARSLEGGSASASASTGVLDVAGAPAKDLSGSASAATSASGSLGVGRRLEGAADAASSAGATLGRTRPLEGDAPAASAASGDLAITKPPVVGLSGSASSASGASSSLARRRGLTGDAATASLADATLVVVAPPKVGLAGQATAASRATALLGVRRALGGDGASASGALAALSRTLGLSGAASAASSAKIDNALDVLRLAEVSLQALDLRLVARVLEPVVDIRSADLAADSLRLAMSAREVDAQTDVRTGRQPTRAPTDLSVAGSTQDPRQHTRLGRQTVAALRLRITARAADLETRPETMEMV